MPDRCAFINFIKTINHPGELPGNRSGGEIPGHLKKELGL